MLEAMRIQERADALAKITASKMETHVIAMEATRAWATEQKLMSEERQQKTAKLEAERIQAEAKARARVAGEAAIIQAQAMAKATAAFEEAQSAVKTLRA